MCRFIGFFFSPDIMVRQPVPGKDIWLGPSHSFDPILPPKRWPRENHKTHAKQTLDLWYNSINWFREKHFSISSNIYCYSLLLALSLFPERQSHLFYIQDGPWTSGPPASTSSQLRSQVHVAIPSFMRSKARVTCLVGNFSVSPSSDLLDWVL